MKTTNYFFLLFLIIFSTACSISGQKNYYISPNGSDNANGYSPSTAWKTFSNIATTQFNPGDSILFESDGEWRGTLRLGFSGTAEDYIVLSSYSEGKRPRILGSESPNTWTETDVKNVWMTTGFENPMKIGWASEIFIEVFGDSVAWGSYKSYDSNLSELKNELDWCYNDNTLYLYCPNNPKNEYQSVEIPQRRWVVALNSSEYVHINNIAVHYGVEVGIGDDTNPSRVKGYSGASFNGLKITNCHISHIGAKNGPYDYGIESNHSNVYIANNRIHNSGRRNISITTYRDYDSIVMRNIVIEFNHFHNGWHTTGLDLNTTGNHLVDSVIFRSNFIEGERYDYAGGISTNGVFVANQSGDYNGIIKNVYVYNNIFTHCRGKAIIFENVQDCWAVNNTIYGTNPEENDWQALISIVSANNPDANLNIYNNIIVNTDPPEPPSFYSLVVDYENIYIPNMDNNLWYGTRNDTWMWEFFDRSGGGLKVIEFRLSGWNSFRGTYPTLEPHSPNPNDPKFTDPSRNIFTLEAGSPAIGAGKKISWITDDYYGNPRPSAPSIGALDVNSTAIEESLIKSCFNFELFPNPSSDYFNIWKSNSSNGLLRLLTLSGVKVYETQCSGEYTICYHSLPAGIYIAQLIENNYIMSSRKIIIN